MTHAIITAPPERAMQPDLRPAGLHRVATSRLLVKALLTVAAMLMSFAAVSYQKAHNEGSGGTIIDFHAFYVAGDLAWQGRVADAYDPKKMEAAQEAFTNVKVFMPWTYPPPFTLFVTALAALPLGLAYAAFASATLAFYIYVVRQIAGAYLPGVIMAILPVFMITVFTGQNGFLTGGLVGMFLLAFLKRRASAGLPLGLMIIKPHLAVAIALLTVAERRWQAVCIAAGVVIIALIMPTIGFGLSIWPAFLDGVQQSGLLLAKGIYPLFRMTSIYAAVRSTGLSPDIAFTVHSIGALVTIGLLALGWWRKLPPHRLAAATCAASLFISPYNYDYDLCILGIGIAFILPDLLARTRPLEQLGLLALSWIGTGYGLFAAFAYGDGFKLPTDYPLAIMAPPLLVLIALVAMALRRDAWVQPAPAAGRARTEAPAVCD